MPFLFGPSLEDRGRLVRAVRAIGPTTVDDLARSLGWSPRKTERLVNSLVRRGEAGLAYSPRLGEVRIGSAPAPESEALPLPVPEPPELYRAPPLPGAPPDARPGAGALAAGTGFRSPCPKCRTSMISTATGESLVCPACGEFALAPSSRPRPAASVDHPASGSAPSDRRAQEMLASYVTSRPISCPRCRSPLRHAGVAAFRCPGCGETVRFDGERPPLPTPIAPSAR